MELVGGERKGGVQWSISGNLNPFQPNGKTKHSPKLSALTVLEYRLRHHKTFIWKS